MKNAKESKIRQPTQALLLLVTLLKVKQNMQPLLTANRETNKIEKTNDNLHTHKHANCSISLHTHARHTTTNTQLSKQVAIGSTPHKHTHTRAHTISATLSISRPWHARARSCSQRELTHTLIGVQSLLHALNLWASLARTVDQFTPKSEPVK